MIFYKEDYIHSLPYNKAKITFDIFFKTKRKRDVANYIGGGIISWLDVLVDLHFIKDDNYDVAPDIRIVYDGYDKERGHYCEVTLYGEE